MAKVKQKPPRIDLTRLYFLLIAALAFVAYANSLSNDFVFDDEIVIRADPSIRTLSSIPGYFAGEQGFFKATGIYYRPLVSSSYALNYASWTLNPFGYHLTNVLIHVLNCVLLYWLLRVMFAACQSRFRDYATLIGAAVFAVHPIHTEAVAWVSGRPDSLCFTFFVLAFISYLKYSQGRSRLTFALTLVCYLLSLLAKEMAITFPAVVILYDLIVSKLHTRRELKQRASIYSALVMVSLFYLIIHWAALKDTPQAKSFLYFYGKDVPTVVCTMLQTIPLYFKLGVVPIGMLYQYGESLPYLSSPWHASVLSAILLLAVLFSVAYVLRRKIPVITYALLFFLLTLLPVLNIVPTVNLMADRFLYVPSMFLSFIVAAAVMRYCSERNVKTILMLSGIVVVAYGGMTIARNADWKTNDRLYMSAAGRRGTLVYVNIGTIYANKGQYDVAEQYFRKALDLRSDHMLANTDLGVLFMATGKLDSAYYYARRAQTLHERSPEPMYTLAQVCIKAGKLPEAMTWLEKIQEVSPGYLNSNELLQRLKGTSQAP